MKKLRILAASAAVALAASAGHAASIQPVTLGGASGSWNNTTSGNVVGFEGEGTDSLKWGKPSTSLTRNNPPKSGYRFAGAAGGGSVAPGTSFDIGTFTHDNNRILMITSQPYTISSTELTVKTNIGIGAANYVFTKVFSFLHDETRNNASTCAHGGAPGTGANGGYGCNDRVTAVVNAASTDELVVDGVKYTFEFEGFRYNGGVVDFFDTVEDASNSATLVGRFNAEALTPVPLPAAGWLLLAGVGGLAALKRRRKHAA